MPELPEVELLRQLLTHRLIHSCIVDACFLSPGILRGISDTEFKAKTKGCVIADIARRGKYLLFTLSRRAGDDDTASGSCCQQRLVLHLRMRGGIRVEAGGSPPDKYLCALLRVEDGREMRFYDMWRWGEWWLAPPAPEPTGISGLDALGVEPFDSAFTTKYLVTALKRSRKPIKPLLLGQRVVAGLGNIYCDDCLNLARLHPSRPANSLSEEEIGRLHQAIGAILNQAIAEAEAKIQSLIAAESNLETFEGLSTQRVYDRPGFPCPTCGESLQKILFHGRGTTFCPQCQPVAATA